MTEPWGERTGPAQRGGSLEGAGADRPAVRVSDAERDTMVARLQRACGEGLLTLDEFSDRVGAALAARTSTDLERLTVDLPALEAPAAPPRAATPRRATQWVVGILGGSGHKGRWRPAPETNAVAFMGGCELDLREAEVEGPELVINAVAVMGGVEIIVPEGIAVELSGLALLGGKECRVPDVPRIPGSPVVRVRAFALMGGVTVRTGKRKRRRTHEPFHHTPWEHHHGAGPRRPPTSEERAERFAASAGEALADLPSLPVDGTVTVLFTDVEDFTGLSERLGDIEAAARLRAHQGIVRREVEVHGGLEVSCQGDGFMIAFDGARRALRAAVAIQREVAAAEAGCEGPMRVRMGLHTGEAIREDEDLFGRTVIVAARIAAAAGGGEILASSLLRQLSDGSGEFRFGTPRSESLKGLAGVHELFPVEWAAPAS